MMTTTATIDRWNPDIFVIAKAARVIKSGGLVAFPTETVYGLGADALNAEAVRKIYEAKGRPSDNPLILHVYSVAHAYQLVYMNDTALKLAEKFWPGPLTMVLPSRPCVPMVTRGGLETAAVRMPDNPVAQALIKYADTPVAAPSANLSGKPSPTDADAVYRDMNGRIDFILDAGSTGVGIESTVIDVTSEGKILMLRPGGTSREAIEDAVHMRIEAPEADSMKRSPGTRYRHYSPDIPVIIWHKDEGEKFPDVKGVAYMGIDDPESGDVAGKILFTSPENYAHGLFAGFREFEAEGYPCIVVQWPEENAGIVEGLRDRIMRASGEG